MKSKKFILVIFTLIAMIIQATAQTLKENPALDEKVKNFLACHSGQWHNMNIPTTAGQLADAHSLVKELKGPFDFVFSDADKDWYKSYFMDVDPKLVAGGCFTTHNISDRRGGYGSGSYLEYVRSLKNYETTLNTAGGGVLISYKRSVK